MKRSKAPRLRLETRESPILATVFYLACSKFYESLASSQDLRDLKIYTSRVKSRPDHGGGIILINLRVKLLERA